jgi:excisionase family DNA binding protein
MPKDESKLIPIREASEILGVSVGTLRRWDENGKLRAIRKTPDGNRYYKALDLEIFPSDLFTLAYEWASAESILTAPIPSKLFCQDSSVFEARLIKLGSSLQLVSGLDQIFSLIVSAAGEIGNNSFDHNLGKWPDITGIFFGYNIEKREIVLADRGLGILKTLKFAVPSLQTHQEALNIAFTQFISGRAPENRGNGLKYVHKIIVENPISLVFISGDAELKISREDSEINVQQTNTPLQGCIALIKF